MPDLLKRIWEVYDRIKGGNPPDTLEEWLDIAQLVLDAARTVFGRGPEGNQPPLSEPQVMAALQSAAVDNVTFDVAKFPLVREAIKLLIPIILEEIRKRWLSASPAQLDAQLAKLMTQNFPRHES